MLKKEVSYKEEEKYQPINILTTKKENKIKEKEKNPYKHVDLHLKVINKIYLFTFIFIFILLTRRKATEALYIG